MTTPEPEMSLVPVECIEQILRAKMHRTSRLRSVRTGERAYGVGGFAEAARAVHAAMLAAAPAQSNPVADSAGRNPVVNGQASPPEAGWFPPQTAPMDGPAFLVCTERRNVYVAFRRSEEGERFMHFASGLAREIAEAVWGWKPSPQALSVAPPASGREGEAG